MLVLQGCDRAEVMCSDSHTAVTQLQCLTLQVFTIAVQPAKPLVFAVGCCRLLPQQAPTITADRPGLFFCFLSLLSLSVQLSAYCLQIGMCIVDFVVGLIHTSLSVIAARSCTHTAAWLT